MPRLRTISIAPIKGTALQHPSTAELTSAGIVGSRRFFLITAQGALFSGSAHGPLVLIHSSVADGSITCRFPDGRTVSNPTDDLGARFEVDFYGRPVSARAVLGPISQALTDYVGQPVTLVRPDIDGAAEDVWPLTIVSSESVVELGKRGDYPGELDARRFRINLELEGCNPFEEDTWDGHEVAIGDAILMIRGPIPRCVVTTQDPNTGIHDWNTLKQIASFRDLLPDHGGVPFGMYAEVVRPAEVRTGAEVSLLDT